MPGHTAEEKSTSIEDDPPPHPDFCKDACLGDAVVDLKLLMKPETNGPLAQGTDMEGLFAAAARLSAARMRVGAFSSPAGPSDPSKSMSDAMVFHPRHSIFFAAFISEGWAEAWIDFVTSECRYER